MKSAESFTQRAALAAITGLENLQMFLFHLILRVSQPLVALGLMYWIMLNLPHYPVPMLPYYSLAWPIIQAVAITGHLAALPVRAVEQYRAKNWASLTLTLTAIALLAVCAIPLAGQFYSPTFTYIRMLALTSILFTEPVAPPHKLVIGIPVISMQVNTSDEQDDDEHPFGPVRVGD